MSTPAERIRSALDANVLSIGQRRDGMHARLQRRRDALAALDELVAENERLQRELDAEKEHTLNEMRCHVKASKERDAAEARCSRLEAALREIAAITDQHTWSESDAEHAAEVAREALTDE